MHNHRRTSMRHSHRSTSKERLSLNLYLKTDLSTSSMERLADPARLPVLKLGKRETYNVRQERRMSAKKRKVNGSPEAQNVRRKCFQPTTRAAKKHEHECDSLCAPWFWKCFKKMSYTIVHCLSRSATSEKRHRHWKRKWTSRR